MGKNRFQGELSLDELLDDDVMTLVLDKTGLNASEFRRQLARIADRLLGLPQSETLSCCGACVG